jgi:hypothetical protein
MCTINFCAEILKKWVEQKQFIQQAKQGFWKCFSNYKEEESENYKTCFKDGDETLISLIEPSMALVINQPNDFVFCSISLGIEYDGKYIGHYKKNFTLDGECSDEEMFF